jgi:transcriptional regulator with XRE-family HTH domain
MAITRQERNAQRVRPVFDLLDRQGRRYSWLARELGIEVQRIYWIADGRQIPQPGFVEQAAALLGVSVAEIFQPTPEPVTTKTKRALLRARAPRRRTTNDSSDERGAHTWQREQRRRNTGNARAM